MCGIAAYLSTTAWARQVDTTPFTTIATDLEAAAAASPIAWKPVLAVLDRLAALFPQLGSFVLHRELATNTAFRQTFEAIAGRLETLLGQARAQVAQMGRSDDLERAQERLADYLWQVRNEALANLTHVSALAPAPLDKLDAASHFLAWSTETVLQSIDKLEVRGRDSAGIGILFPLDLVQSPSEFLSPALAQELTALQAADELGARQWATGKDDAGHWTVRATYKVANLVGRLGDNGRALRAAIHNDPILWALAPHLTFVNILSHTRWASNGIINVPNCHPVDGRTLPIHTNNTDAKAATFIMNGDVDNYATLVSGLVKARGQSINPAVSTDTKILPVTFAMDTNPADSLDTRFLGVMRRCHGSFAIGLQHLEHPDHLLFGQKGSGQALYLGEVPEGYVAASEVYGIAALCRSYWPMNAGGEQGATLDLQAGDLAARIQGFLLAGNTTWIPSVEPIQIFARDIFRGDYPTYIEKEIAEAPSSIAKTLAGKYAKQDGQIRFLIAGFGNGDLLLRRLKDRDLPPIRRIIVVGQGTAAIAGMGIAHLIRRSVAAAGLTVEAGTASELFGFVSDGRFDDTLLVAVSQSGTTTDTNRIVDLAKARGAWIHAIVNRRNSALVQKAHSFLYTSDGRDVEMSVASTKAYYAQVTAGKLLGLLLADTLGTLSARSLKEEIDALEALPAKVQTVLDRREAIAEIAGRLAPTARNWALVGNGANRIAAQEIRIKLSELCYKAIPCDVTEDKKHIDLSTEPLTLVIANDLPEMVVSDTVKEVSIFKAHNGRPIVLCADGENRFDPVAEATISVPTVGGGLDFVAATVAGHLFGIAAALAIDESCTPFRALRAVLSSPDSTLPTRPITQALSVALDSIEQGRTDSALAAALAVRLAKIAAQLAQAPSDIAQDDPLLSRLREVLNKVIDDLTRPIDTIRHQAKTVTVGISRPQAEVSPLILEALTKLDLGLTMLADRDREMLETLSPLILSIDDAVTYAVTGRLGEPDAPQWEIQITHALKADPSTQSRYHAPGMAEGTKRRALRTGSAVASTGPLGTENILVLPLYTPSGTSISGLLLLHVGMAPEASLQQKISLLKAIGHKFDELVEHLAHTAQTRPLETVLAAASPALLVFGEVHTIAVP